MGAPSGDGDADAEAEAEVDAEDTPASFDQLLRRAAAARARHRDSEPDPTEVVAASENGAPGEAAHSPSEDQPG